MLGSQVTLSDHYHLPSEVISSQGRKNQTETTLGYRNRQCLRTTLLVCNFNNWDWYCNDVTNVCKYVHTISYNNICIYNYIIWVYMIKKTHWTKEHNLGGTTLYHNLVSRPETLGKGHLGSWLRVRKHARMLDMILPCISTLIVSRFTTFGFILEWLCQTAMTPQVSTSCTHPALCQQVIPNKWLPVIFDN
jgi:hypothetical protein